ncbi:cytochrome c biogenesis heme-transporting ATPase CcmA [Undibacterium flavidum]|uniref:Cytochrome c biogenesis heme-transporting ATPase CcmA n=1 Tax=Undibacterium flavidum TaxID=2762297 RepID=A0ABR6YBL9_9BURK|nr:cytochrome c biogenesis heme-transporting ATPase CcmA [Undibacterium flavidum]MBC3874010.1 cytochrome c biogenesis heme-transporting ATPase CcmA [Undibacterium flavidum]
MSLSAISLSSTRGARLLFSNLHLELKAGESLWLTGENGAGKSSLLRLLCGLSLPQAGKVYWQTLCIREHREEFHQNLLYIGHQFGIKGDLSAAENLASACQMQGRAHSAAAIHNALAAIGLGAQADLPARVLSQGQQKRVALARLFFASLPTLLILDEPFSALDRTTIALLLQRLRIHLKQGGMLIYTSHQEFALMAALAVDSAVDSTTDSTADSAVDAISELSTTRQLRLG